MSQRPLQFYEGLAARERARQPPQHQEYPKFVRSEGREALALDADDELRILLAWDAERSEEAAEDGESQEPRPNAFAAPEKRGPGRPRKYPLSPDTETP